MMEPSRTWLFAPGDHPERCLKAVNSQADQVIWDLEDGVDASKKKEARKSLADLLAKPLPRIPWIRINCPATPWARDDMEILARAHAHKMPKWVISKSTRKSVREVLQWGFPGQWLFIVETAQGVADLLDMNRPWDAGGSARLALGALDYRNDIGAFPTEEEAELAVPRTLLVLASRLWDWPPPIDAVYPFIDDVEGMEYRARRARQGGMGGVMIIHPRQIPAVHQAYEPSSDEIAWAQQVMAAAANSGAIRVEGMMVDRPVVERARRILAAVPRQ